MGNSDFLFVKPSLLNGIARTMDVFAGFTEYHVSKTPEEADYLAVLHDIRAIYKDLEISFQQVKEKTIG